MKIFSKKIERLSKLLNIVIALVLCFFLISLSGRVMRDMEDWGDKPRTSQFLNDTLIANSRAAMVALDEERALALDNKQRTEKAMDLAEANYNNAKSSYENWLKARTVIGSPTEDQAVLSRAEQLDEYHKTAQAWAKKLSGITTEIETLQKRRNAFQDKINKETKRAKDEQTEAYRAYDLKVFLGRLLIILPILLLGIYFIIKFRNHKYWPLFLGYVLFSFYSFFVGLIPYLPHYGGYVRYTVGIVLSVLLGGYGINKIRAFVAKRKEELKASTEERAKKVVSEIAEKALNEHACPSCGKDFLVKQWDKGTGKAVADFCRYCGMELFKKCKRCETENFAHLPYCSGCGDRITDEEETQ
ncbi:hypothetical protein FUAX_07070 [Fulvitalea axinellae]|uniref:Zinc ribbon domain-containing protein n=1 Tax=Fulvitalea axinellae TaxID=1182444 RepID=A0AAU9DBT8_9BACT|nr:hypothetical protein FUAX_07070 [Fulvitalea axinellae]